MARANAAPTVTPDALTHARGEVSRATERVAEARAADPNIPGWGAQLEDAERALRSATRRCEVMEEHYADQLARRAQRDAVAREHAAEIDDMAAGLAATAGRVRSALEAHLRALVDAVATVDEYNALITRYRDRLSSLGLLASSRLGDIEIRFPEGADAPYEWDRGLRAGGRHWRPVPADALISSAVRQSLPDSALLGHVGEWGHSRDALRGVAEYLTPPSLADVGARVRQLPGPAWPSAASIEVA